jgi:hypothetical protein
LWLGVVHTIALQRIETAVLDVVLATGSNAVRCSVRPSSCRAAGR